ncbi:MAG TPA: DUF2723 domain-containing protein [bacterium]|nr:DUF2723 domain-containing protein [bacterium]
MNVRAWFIRLFWLVPLVFYGATVCRWPNWVDGPMIAGNVYALKLSVWVNTHNLFHLLGRLWTTIFPFGEFHVRLNFLCAVFGAVTVTFLFLAGMTVTKNAVASAAGAIAVMFGHSLWWHSTILEVYTLNTALLAIFLYLVASYEETGSKRRLYGAVFVWGLGCSNHVLMGLFVFAFPAILLVSAERRRLLNPRTLAALAFFFLLGFSPYLVIFVREFHHRAPKVFSAKGYWNVLQAMVNDTTGAQFRRYMFPSFMSSAQKWRWRLNYLFLLLMNYPSVAFLGGWVGLAAFARTRAFRATFVFFLAGLAAQAVWSSNYMIWDMYAFGLPVWVLFGFAVIVGFDDLWRRSRITRAALLVLLPTLLAGPVLYAKIPSWAAGPGFWRNYFRYFEYVSNIWDPARYFANPNKRHYDDVERFARRMFEILPQGAILYDDDGKGYYPLALYYRDVLKVRTDIRQHMIVGPAPNSDSIPRAAAQELLADLQRGGDVYVSSPYWPERPMLDQLYSRLAGLSLAKPVSPSTVARLSVEELERTFPVYELNRVVLFPDRPYFIYHVVRRPEPETGPR